MEEVKPSKALVDPISSLLSPPTTCLGSRAACDMMYLEIKLGISLKPLEENIYDLYI